MDQKPVRTGRPPVLAIFGGAVLALSLFLPLMLLTKPLLVTLGFAIASGLRKERPRRLPYVLGGAALLLLVFLRLYGEGGPTQPETVNRSAMFGNATWEYGQDKDEMRGTVSKNATLYSATDLNLPAPYDGANAARIFVSDNPGIILSVWEGQFVCNSSPSVAVKVDNGPVLSYPCATSENGQTNYLFINPQNSPDTGQPTDPRDLLTKGRKLTIEAEFYVSGSRQIVFNIAGFNPKKLK